MKMIGFTRNTLDPLLRQATATEADSVAQMPDPFVLR